MDRKNVELVKYNRNTGYYILGISILIIIIIIIYNNKLIFKPKRKISVLETGEAITFKEDTEIVKSISSIPGISNNNLFAVGMGYKLEIDFMIRIPNTDGSEKFNSLYNVYKPIIRFGNSPQILFNHANNKMKILINFKDYNNFKRNYQIEHRLHLQKWNHISLIINGKNLNLLINGVNVKNHLLNLWPIISTNLSDNVIIGKKNNNIIGEIKDVFININK